MLESPPLAATWKEEGRSNDHVDNAPDAVGQAVGGDVKLQGGKGESGSDCECVGGSHPLPRQRTQRGAGGGQASGGPMRSSVMVGS